MGVRGGWERMRSGSKRGRWGERGVREGWEVGICKVVRRSSWDTSLHWV